MNILLLFASIVSLVSAYTPFLVDPITTHQPIGNNEGQTNYYQISFNVSSSNGAAGANASGECAVSWSDNSWAQSEAYSLYVPTGSWIACGSSEFSFQLFPYFSIGNFTLAIQQNLTDVDANGTTSQILAAGSTLVSNTTGQYACAINPAEVQYTQHAHGDCSLAANTSAINVPVTSTSPAPAPASCPAGASVNTTFLTTAQTSPGQTVLVVGSAAALGSWAPAAAVAMASADNDGSVAAATWAASVAVAAGTQLEWKYLLRNESSGAETWECCENRAFTVPAAGACEAVAGNDPDTFRAGGDAVAGS
ncbi:hypothetical protein MBLNU459_g1561t1 [Dothideomycetes sp. NU459]